MRRTRLAKTLLLGVIIAIPISFAKAQGILFNKSFENAVNPPNFCLPFGSGHGGFFLEIQPEDYFDRLTNWVSYYKIDPTECNIYTGTNCLTAYSHSPDWIGGNFSPCPQGWDQNYSVGMFPYEVIWQDFVGLEDKYLDINKCYEVRIKVQLDYSFFSPPPFDPTGNKGLDVLLGTQAFTYIDPIQAYTNTGTNCSETDCYNCRPIYREYFIAPTEAYQSLDRFPIDYINALGSQPYSGYSFPFWFEFHGVIRMSDFDFPSFAPLDPEFVQFGLDFRDPDPSTGSCPGQYLNIDWIEFFEACPDHYDLFGAMIAGPQDDYLASNYIKAGFIDKGPSIVTKNGRTKFKTGHFVELVPGFLSDYGSVLDITADPNFLCPNCLPHRSMDNEQLIEVFNNREVVKDSLFNKTTQNNINTAVHIFPNPTTEICVISSSDNNIISIQILGSMNQVIRVVENVNKKDYELDISNLGAGIYYFVVTTVRNEIVYKKIVKI